MSDASPTGVSSNKPKILRGAFVEFGLSLPPLVVVFQFNPLQLTRNRGLTFAAPNADPGAGGAAAPTRTIRQFHGQFSSLLDLQKEQLVTVAEQTIGFELRLDATDKLGDNDTVVEQFGISPQIATLELMTYPKSDSLIGGVLAALGRSGFSFTQRPNPPLILFVFGRKRVLPVNINSMNITETEFSADLNPVRATVAVSLTVIEGKSVPYLYTKAMTEAMSVLNLTNLSDVANVVMRADPMTDPASRYRLLPNVTLPNADGLVVLAKELRLQPQVTGTFRHRIQQGDRLDEVASRYYGAGTLWWRICDANPDAQSPLDLLCGGPVSTTRIAARPAAGNPDWAALVKQLRSVVGVSRVVVLHDEAVLITHNRATVPTNLLIAEIASSGFSAGPAVEAGPAGHQIIVPARDDG